VKFLDRIEEIIGGVSLGVMVTIAFVNVLTRYLFKYSMAFTEELTLYLFVWATLMGASIAFREGSNIAVSFLYDRFGLKGRRMLDVLSAVLSVVFFTTLAYYGVIEVMDEIAMGAMTEAIELPMWWFTIAMPICSLLIILRVLARLRIAFRTETTAEGGE
jgi:TRAP-type C4-dicarboxylate transport system permease small subunit